jgi:catalase
LRTLTTPDFHRRDLWEAIESGAYPEYEFGLQIFTQEQAERFSFDVLDATKIVPEELVPVKPDGKMVLNRNPDNFFAETEQVAFCASHIVPGLDFANDPLLAGRLHSYLDTQLSRLGGPNFHEIPINAPVAQVHNNQRDGMHRQSISRGRVAYEPNSLVGGCPFQAGAARGFTSLPEPVREDKVRGKPELLADHYSQAALFWNSQSPVEKSHIVRAFRFELSRIQTPSVRERVVAMIANVAPELGQSLAAGLGMRMSAPLPRVLEKVRKPEVTASPALSLLARPGDGSIRTRRVAILLAEGAGGEAARMIHQRLAKEGTVPRFVGLHLGPVKTADDDAIEVEVTMEVAPAVLYDALAVLLGPEGMTTLANVGLAAEFIKDQYRHCKPILALGAGKDLVESAGVPATLPSESRIQD